MSEKPDAYTVLRQLGFNPTANGLDYGVRGLADRLARTERALEETREIAAEAKVRGAAIGLRVAADRLDAGSTVGVVRAVQVEALRRLSAQIETGEVPL